MRKLKMQCQRWHADTIEMHVNFVIAPHIISKLYGGQTADDILSDVDGEVSPNLRSLVEGINAIEGLGDWFINPHSVQVGKALLYEWDDIRPELTRLIEQYALMEYESVVELLPDIEPERPRMDARENEALMFPEGNRLR